MPWLNRTVIGAGVTSFLADTGYEMATAILPAFLQMLRIPPESVGAVLGLIEGTADLLANAVKIAVGWYSDRIGQRKAFVVGGYALTGSAFALCALALSGRSCWWRNRWPGSARAFAVRCGMPSSPTRSNRRTTARHSAFIAPAIRSGPSLGRSSVPRSSPGCRLTGSLRPMSLIASSFWSR